jgi:ABC-2 type transport system permease protein
MLILPELKNQNFDELEKDTRLVINKQIGFDTKQRIVSDISNVIKKENQQLGIQETQLDDLIKLQPENH